MSRIGHRATIVALAVLFGAGALGTPIARAATAPPLPAHLYAPYFETWTSDSLSATATASGARYFTLAFLQTLGKGSCTLAWNGSRSQTIPAGRYLADIATLRGMGGDVIPSFGGWSADQGGTEIGDSCKDVNAIVAAYQLVVTTYGVTRLDMDIEGNSLGNSAGIDRRNKAIALLLGANAGLQVQYTLPTNRSGLTAPSLAVLQNAVANGITNFLVNPMAFDYYDRAITDMGDSAISALTGLHGQLRNILGSGPSDAALWAMEGVTLMPGIDDYNRKTEVTTIADAQEVLAFAQTNGLAALSIWAIQRDNGGCPGRSGSGSCSGIIQGSYDFSHVLEPFSGS